MARLGQQKKKKKKDACVEVSSIHAEWWRPDEVG